MSFLQPWMLIALPIAALPIIIHLINQRRYQTTQWAAMRFLLAANRMTRGYARIRQWAILAMRTLAILALIVAIGRPLASGSLGGGWLTSIAGGSAAQTIVILDRSPSMQSRGIDPTTKLQSGVTQCAETLATIGTGRLVLIDSATMKPIEIASPDELLSLPQTGPSDASADLPAMLLLAEEFIQRNPVGQTGVWIISDNRLHDWRADDSRWSSIRQSFVSIADRVRFRLLDMTQPTTRNRSVWVSNARFDRKSGTPRVLLSFDVSSSGMSGFSGNPIDAPEKIPVTIELAGSSTTVDLEFDGRLGRLLDHPIDLPADAEAGWGRVSIPADTLEADNRFYFTFQPPPPRRTLIVSDNQEVSRTLKIAAESSSDESVTSVAEIVTPVEFRLLDHSDVALVLWQEPTSTDDLQSLEAIVRRGGSLIFFPHEDQLAAPSNPSNNLPSGQIWPGLSFGQSIEMPSESSPKSWRGDAGLLAATLAGTSLPVGQIQVRRMAPIVGETSPLASMDDGSPLLVRVGLVGETERVGEVHAMATTPAAKDSSLAVDGVVLVVMIQRAIANGASSLIGSGQATAGDIDLDANSSIVAGGEGRLTTERSTTAGIVIAGDRMMAINRDLGEDTQTLIDDTKLQSLFAGLTMQRVSVVGGQSGSLVEEIWRGFLIAVLLAMLTEAVLCMPRRMLANDARLSITDPQGRMAA